MAVEKKRGCGFRKLGGLYLAGGGAGVPCDRLPLRLDVCPVCSHGFKQTRGWTWVDLPRFVGGVHPQCEDEFTCPLCMAPHQIGKAGLLWIGERFYKTPAAFLAEGKELGLSRRLGAVPRNFKLGETWVMLAHPKAIYELSETVPEGTATLKIETGGGGNPLVTVLENEGVLLLSGDQRARWVPGVFYLWRPSRIEKIVKESERYSDAVKQLIDQGITPVFVPDNDADHQGTVYDQPKRWASSPLGEDVGDGEEE